MRPDAAAPFHFRHKQCHEPRYTPSTDRPPERAEETLNPFVRRQPVESESRTGTTKIVWIGRAISVLISLLFLMSAAIKLKGGPELAQGMAHMGLPESMVLPLAILELSCVILYLIPATSVLGAILLTGFLGGAICTHWRVGDAFYLHIVFGILIWLGLYLRDGRLRELIPLRKNVNAAGVGTGPR